MKFILLDYEKCATCSCNLRFKHFIKKWADSKVIIDHLRDEAQFSPYETTKAFLLNRAEEIEQELELRMVDSQMLIQSAKK